jgi:SAM-dependent methyltransferase
MKVDNSEVVFHLLSGADPHSRVFWWKGGLYRAIHGDQVPFYEHLLSAGIIRNLVRRKLLVDTEATDLELDGYGLVLKQQIVPFVSYCYEWCGEMLKAAALLALELETELLNHGAALWDLRPHNVLFVGTTPIWIDLGALGPVSDLERWDSFEMFSAYFTRPLKIMAAGHSRIARCLLRDGYGGVHQREVQAITETASAGVVRAAKTTATAGAKKIIPLPLRPYVRRTVQRLARSTTCLEAHRKSSVTGAVREIEKIRLVQASSECLGGHDDAGFPDFTLTANWTEKRRSILRVLLAKKPGSVLDTGSDRGWYSQLAARNGAQVVCADFDEAAVAKLYSNAVAAKLPIMPLIIDFRNTGPQTAMTNAPGLAPAERLRCDMVLALAPIYHLAVTAPHWHLVVRALSDFARKWLVIEFIGRDDPHMKELSDDPRGIVASSCYSLDTLLALLNKEFAKIDLLPSENEHRRILLCERRQIAECTPSGPKQTFEQGSPGFVSDSE